LALDPQTSTTLYAGAYRGGVYKSTDGGGTWSAVNTGLTNMARMLAWNEDSFSAPKTATLLVVSRSF
jgi:photosystem II stability/assembly factor-like uncharacterized protein